MNENIRMFTKLPFLIINTVIVRISGDGLCISENMSINTEYLNQAIETKLSKPRLRNQGFET